MLKDGMVIFFLWCFRKVIFRKMQFLKDGVQTVGCKSCIIDMILAIRGVTIYRCIGILRYGARGTVYRYAHTRIPVYRNTVRVLY